MSVSDPDSSRARWVFLPVLGAALVHAPILRFDLLPGLRRPISQRLFAANKTWRLGGTLDAERLASRRPIDGTLVFKLFDERRLPYRLAFTGDDGKRYELSGQKEWSGLAPVESITLLTASLYDEAGEELGRATLRFDLRADWVRWMKSFRIRLFPQGRRDGAPDFGAVALGALAVGAVAMGKLALGQLAPGRAEARGWSQHLQPWWVPGRPQCGPPPPSFSVPPGTGTISRSPNTATIWARAASSSGEPATGTTTPPFGR